MDVTLFIIKFYLQKWAVGWIWSLGQYLPTHDIQHTNYFHSIILLLQMGGIETLSGIIQVKLKDPYVRTHTYRNSAKVNLKEITVCLFF